MIYCIFTNCNNIIYAKDLCKKHYYKNYNKYYYLKNQEQIKTQTKEYFIKTYIPHPKIFPKKECMIFDCEMKHYGRGLCKIHYLKNYNKENPTHKSNMGYPIELQLAMNNVRKRDNNTCQWYDCKLTVNETIIHVHHIFPKSKYPELQLIEKYMICYCGFHHSLFHEYRGDFYYKLIINNPLISKHSKNALIQVKPIV